MKLAFLLLAVFLSLAEGTPCPTLECKMGCQHGFQTDDNGCAVCTCNQPPVGLKSKTKISISVHSSGGCKPRLFVQLAMNPGQQHRGFVPESCYTAPSMSRFPSSRRYLIRNTFPAVRYFQPYTISSPRLFTFSVPQNVDLYRGGQMYLHCNSRVCQSPSQNCRFKSAKSEDGTFGYSRSQDEKARDYAMVHSVTVLPHY